MQLKNPYFRQKTKSDSKETQTQWEMTLSEYQK